MNQQHTPRKQNDPDKPWRRGHRIITLTAKIRHENKAEMASDFLDGHNEKPNDTKENAPQ